MQIHQAVGNVLEFVLYVFTLSYAGPLNHYTIEPINNIRENQYNEVELPSMIYDFKIRKEQELQFVQRAAALSAAAVIGICSWSDVAISFWVSQTFWHCSLSFSVFALISSVYQRLLENFPNTQEDAEKLTECQIRALLRVFLKPSKRSIVLSKEEEDVEQGHGVQAMDRDNSLVWVWQSPMMMMSFSWLWFLLGYAFYIMQPLIVHTSPTPSIMNSVGAVISICVAFIAVVIFLINARIARRIIEIMAEMNKSK